MIINALNANVRVFMADFEDSLAPTWDNVVQGQVNLRDANLGTIDFTNPDGRKYTLNGKHAVLIARVRGLHLTEKHVGWNGEQRIPGCLFDFGLYFFHNYQRATQRGSGVYYYMPKIQIARRGEVVGRRVRVHRRSLQRSARHDQGDVPDRDVAGRVPDGRDSVRAARSHRRAQLRSLGLHLQLHQDAATPSRTACCPIGKR